MQEIKSTTSYAGRQLDLECLQTMPSPSRSYVELAPSVSYDTPKIVSGPQKLAQRYVVLFTTIIGSDIMDPSFGTTFLGRIDLGNFGGYSDIELLANEANLITMERIIEDDENTDLYGNVPDDEKLAKSWVSSVYVNRATRSIDVHVSILTKAGNNIVFVVPTTAGIY